MSEVGELKPPAAEALRSRGRFCQGSDRCLLRASSCSPSCQRAAVKIRSESLLRYCPTYEAGPPSSRAVSPLVAVTTSRSALRTTVRA